MCAFQIDGSLVVELQLCHILEILWHKLVSRLLSTLQTLRRVNDIHYIKGGAQAKGI